MRRGRTIGLAVVVCAIGLVVAAPAGAFSFSLDILSGSSWLSATAPSLVGNIGSSTAPGAWTTVGFNDSGWVPAIAVPNSVITPQTVVPGTAAQFMWSPQGMQGNPTGANGVPDAFFRYEFNLPEPPASPPGFNQVIGIGARTNIIADDRFDFYVNGQFVKAATLAFHMDPTDPSGKRPLPVFENFPDKLNYGNNVLAIRGRDGIPGSNVDPGDPFTAQNRVNQYVFFDGELSLSSSLVPLPPIVGGAAAPEPGTFLLLGSGLVGLVAWRRKQQILKAIN